MSRWIVTIEEDPTTGDLLLPLPDQVVEELQLNDGDVLDWTVMDNGSVILQKHIEKELVFVECVNQYRTRYLVEVPKGKQEWALDTVTCNQAKIFSEEHLTEVIVSSRVISEEEAIVLGKQDNPHLFKFTTPNSSDINILASLITREGV